MKSGPLIKLYYYIMWVWMDEVLIKLIFLKADRKELINLVKAY